jgi:hypothetical protein
MSTLMRIICGILDQSYGKIGSTASIPGKTEDWGTDGYLRRNLHYKIACMAIPGIPGTAERTYRCGRKRKTTGIRAEICSYV